MSKEYKLDELLGGITDKNLHKPIETVVSIGRKLGDGVLLTYQIISLV